MPNSRQFCRSVSICFFEIGSTIGRLRSVVGTLWSTVASVRSGRRTVRPATGYRLTANTTTFVVDAPGPGLAVLAESFYRDDFQVTVDGRPAVYFRVNHAFKGVTIAGAGRHEITFAYWPEHFTLALVLGAMGLLLLAAGAHWLWHGGWIPGSLRPSAP